MDPTVISWSIHVFSIYYWYMMYKVLALNSSEEMMESGMSATLPPSMWLAGVMATSYTVVSFVMAVLEKFNVNLSF